MEMVAICSQVFRCRTQTYVGCVKMEKLLQKSDNLRVDNCGDYLEWKKADSENNTCMLSSAFSLKLSLLLRCR